MLNKRSILAGLLALCTLGGTGTHAHEVVIADFPLGVGGAIDKAFFEPYHPQLQALADTLARQPLARAVIVGKADGTRYQLDNDAKNPGLSLGRAHVLRNLLVHEFGVDSTQILIQTVDVKARGGQFRQVSVRIDWELVKLAALAEPAQPPVVQLPAPEPPAPSVTQVSNYLTENLGLRLGAGISSSPFGGVPVASGALYWKRFMFAEAVVGHTFWSGSFRYRGVNLITWRRLIGGRLSICPTSAAWGIVGGWMRIEEISRDHYEYVKLSEGPLLGLRVTPFRHATISGLFNPSRHRVADQELSRARNGQFLLDITLHTDIGGGR